MRAWEPEEGELKNGGKAWRAFKTYRDMGPGRNLRAVARALYGERQERGRRTVEKWSSKFDWVERVSAMEARDEMIRNEAVQLWEESEEREFIATQRRLRKKALECAEKALDNEMRMLDYPLTVQETVQPDPEDPDGMVTYVIHPAGWNKNTAARMHAIAKASLGNMHDVEEFETDDGDEIPNPVPNTKEVRDATDRFLEQLEQARERGTGPPEPSGPGGSGEPPLG